jgi:Ser/Thr protein kinase RdoA (MazF antagonist)
MSEPISPLAAIHQEPPGFDADTVAGVVAAHFGLHGEFVPLVSERDQNFELLTAAGGRCVVKVTNAAEHPETTAFQAALLRHLAHVAGLRVPRIVPALDGHASVRIRDGNTMHQLRVVSWVPGEQLEALPMEPLLARRFGAALARIDQALQGLAHPGDTPVLLWDLQRTGQLRGLLGHIDDALVRQAAENAVDNFEARVLPISSELRSQVIHSDANPENVLLSDEGFGFIDFGDAIRAPLIFEVAIAASYLRSAGPDPLEFIAPFVAGFHHVEPLTGKEVGLLFDLVRARLATTLVLMHWRLGARPADDPYRQKSRELESDAPHFLAALDRLGRKEFTRKINKLWKK